MDHLTVNRPKCLVSIGGKPILYSIIDAFGSNKETIIISDYKSEVLDAYLENFPPPVTYTVIKANGSGSLAGINEAIKSTDGEGFAVTWSDLYFTSKMEIGNIQGNSIGLSNDIKCRWSYVNGKLIEEPNIYENHMGIVGIFLFPNPELLKNIPRNGEFVRFLSDSEFGLNPLIINGIKEIGTYETYRKTRDEQVDSRFFNSVSIKDNNVVKKPKDPAFSKLIVDEIRWYRHVSNSGFDGIPQINSYEPLSMEFVRGIHPYSLVNHEEPIKNNVLTKIYDKIEELHRLGITEFKYGVAKEVYVKKTLDRIRRVSNLIPHNTEKSFIVNGYKVPNLMLPEYQTNITEIFDKLLSKGSHFSVIHGDPTFSNTILRNKEYEPIFIDPRGYFGSLKVYGDPLYDYAKLYYSAVGNYDFFNQGRFQLRIDGSNIDLKIESERFEESAKLMEDRLDKNVPSIKALHALIWLSLAGYVIDDYDAILASYFNGLRIFHEVFDEYA